MRIILIAFFFFQLRSGTRYRSSALVSLTISSWSLLYVFYGLSLSAASELSTSTFQGDQIELMLNRRFPISTMAAAALGNTVSDVIGIGSVHYVEMFAQKVGFQAPKLTLVQLNLPRTRIAANVVWLSRHVSLNCYLSKSHFLELRLSCCLLLTLNSNKEEFFVQEIL